MKTEIDLPCYITFDEFGAVSVGCMNCGNIVKSRMEIPSKTFPGRIVYALGSHSDYREIAVLLSDNSLANIVVCDRCVNIEVNEKQSEILTQQIALGRKAELEHAGREQVVVDAMYKSALNSKRVVRRFTDEELKEIFGGKK